MKHCGRYIDHRKHRHALQISIRSRWPINLTILPQSNDGRAVCVLCGDDVLFMDTCDFTLSFSCYSLAWRARRAGGGDGGGSQIHSSPIPLPASPPPLLSSPTTLHFYAPPILNHTASQPRPPHERGARPRGSGTLMLPI